MAIRKLTQSSIINNVWHKSMLAANNYPGQLDQTFNPSDNYSSFNSFVNVVHFQSDGKILIGGAFTAYNGVPYGRIIRLNPDYTVDKTFNTGTGSGGTIDTICQAHDGTILIGGGFTSFNGSTRNRIARLDSDGTLLSTFSGTALNSTAHVIKRIPGTERYIVAGGFTTYAGNNAEKIIVIDVSGALVNASPNTYPSKFAGGNVFSIEFTSTRIIVYGSFTSFNGVTNNRIMAFTLSSTPEIDTTFTTGTGINVNPESSLDQVAVQSDGKILIGIRASAVRYNGTNVGKLFRLNANGTLDTTFTNIIPDVIRLSIATLSNNKIIVMGNFVAGQISGGTGRYIIGLNSDGTRDASFNVGTGLDVENNVTVSPSEIAVDSSNKIFISGNFNSYKTTGQGRLIVIDSSGNLVFPANGINGITISFNAFKARQEPDNKFLIYGWFSNYNGYLGSTTDQSNGVIVRINEDGTRDTSFTSPNNLDGPVRSVEKQSDGKIIVAGSFITPANSMIRLNTNGTRDTSFTSPISNINIISIAVQSDDKILVGGNFTAYSGTTIGDFLRLNSNGTLDTAYNANVGTGFAVADSVSGIRLQSDGKAIVFGALTNYNGTTVNRICRINTNGTLDTTFNSGGAGPNNAVNECIILPDGKIIVAGAFSTYNDVSKSNWVRLNSDGTLDNTFANEASAGSFNILARLTNGDFIGRQGTSLFRFNSDGNLLYSLRYTSDGSTLAWIQPQGIDKALVFSVFTFVNGVPKNGIARIFI